MHFPSLSSPVVSLRRAGLRLPGAACLGLLLATAPVARAQVSTLYAASYGSDANPGTRTSPKRSIQAAHDASPANGAVVVLDPAEYGVFAVNRGITVDVAPGVTATVSAAGNNVGLFVGAATTDTVTLRGLTIQGQSNVASPNGGVGLYAASVGVLRVENCTVHNFALGMLLQSTTSAQFAVRGCTVRDVFNGIAVTNGANGGYVDAVISDTLVDKATNTGVFDFVSGRSGAAQATVNHCVISHNATGLFAQLSGLMVVADCTISGNGLGVTYSGGLMVSSGNNAFTTNGSDGTFTGTKPTL